MCDMLDNHDSRPLWTIKIFFFYVFYISAMLSTPILFIRNALRDEDNIILIMCMGWLVAGIIGFFGSIVFFIWMCKKKSDQLYVYSQL